MFRVIGIRRTFWTSIKCKIAIVIGSTISAKSGIDLNFKLKSEVQFQNIHDLLPIIRKFNLLLALFIILTCVKFNTTCYNTFKI